MRDPETGKTVTAPPMTFKEWKEKYGSDSETAKTAKNLIPPTDDFIKSIAEKRGKPYTVGKEGEDRFYDDNGAPIYPPNNGAVGKKEEITLQLGTLISRYGEETGRFAAPQKTAIEERSLSKELRDKGEYHVYIAVSTVKCFAGTVAPWFGQKGGGIQYRFEKRVRELVEDGVLIEKDVQHIEPKDRAGKIE